MIITAEMPIHPWLARIGLCDGALRPGTDIHWVGTGFAIAPRCVLTCAHVVLGWADCTTVVVEFVTGMRCEVSPKQLYCDKSLDMALLSINQDAPAAAVLITDHYDYSSCIDCDFVAYGFPPEMKGKFQRVIIPGAQFASVLQGDGVTGELTFIKNPVGLNEGYSGGPLLYADHPEQPVVAINTLGGRKAAVGGYNPVQLAVNLAFQRAHTCPYDITPTGLLTWEAALAQVRGDSPDSDLPSKEQAAEVQRQWSVRLGLHSPKVTLSFTMNHRCYRETFVLVPPFAGGKPFWLQQTVISAPMLKQSNDNRLAACGECYSNTLAIAQAMSRHFGVTLYLPSFDEWLHALTAAGAVPLPVALPSSVNNGNELPPRFDMSQEGHPFAIQRPPQGCYELLRSTVSTKKEQIRAWSAQAYHYGQPDYIDIPISQCDSALVCRFAIAATADLSPLSPVWEEVIYD